MRKILALMLILVLFTTGCSSDKKEYSDYVKIDTSYGEIIAQLYPDVAPLTVKNFKKLVSENFYEGSKFHRVIKDFMIQGGINKDPNKKADTIKGEFSSNGVVNNLKHTRGVLSMARTYIPDSASSQFFIMHKDTASLDGNYAAFGKVVKGMDVVDKIANVETDDNDAPLEDVIIKNITFTDKK